MPPVLAKLRVSQHSSLPKGRTQRVSGRKVVGKVAKFNICFRPERLTSYAGIVLLHNFAQRLGVAQVLDDELTVKTRERGYPESETVRSLVYNTILGRTCLSDLAVLRENQGTQVLLGVDRVLAPATAGEFLRKFDLGDVHDLQRVQQRVQERVSPVTCSPLPHKTHGQVSVYHARKAR